MTFQAIRQRAARTPEFDGHESDPIYPGFTSGDALNAKARYSRRCSPTRFGYNPRQFPARRARRAQTMAFA
ncbi:MAG: hypothetical protein A3G25_12520 [Betaproteobacteria bacterium RIFCSPLOWO2_12_FULL_63_13]|nr:MAG: hypothetical protein A3G25_12520 [Betaproteobacteria bacterium RIFCSPLOWO2_12_FULL_63_13]